MSKQNEAVNLGVSRREVVAGIGAASAGLVFGFSLPLTPNAAMAAGTITKISAWIAIGTDESVTIQIGAQEMGQGIMSGLAQVAASELMVDWTKVQAQIAPANPIYANPLFMAQMTGGSTSMRGFFQPMRVAGATVREMLKQAAANAWGVPVSSCTADNGVVTSGANSMTYGQLAPAAALLTPPASPPILGTNPILGTSVPRLDIPSKLDGSAIFGIDVRVPNMVYAAIKQCPTIGGTLPATYKPAVPTGAIAVVPLGNAVAVVANTTWTALRLAKQLSVSWTLPSTAASMDSAAIATAATKLMSSTSPAIAESVGSANSAITGAAKKLSVTYTLPYLAHACMEPLNCTASVTATTCEIWAPTQAPAFVAATAAAITGFSMDKITVHTTFMGGGLGRKFETDYISQAIRVSKALLRPVKLTWSREEDFGHDQYRPMALIRINAGLDSSGNIVGWANRIVSPSILYQRNPASLVNGVDSQAVDGAVGLDYNFKSRLVEFVRHTAPNPVGFWRSVGHSLNAFSVESAIDELALLGNIDPLVFRQRLLANSPRGLAVLNAAAQLGGWSSTLPAGRARGIAYSVGFGSIVAQMAEISQPVAGSIKVHRVACAIDCGPVVNPDSVIAQMEGSIVHGLSAALWGQIKFTKGVSGVTNFNKYRVLRMLEMPQIDVTLVKSDGPVGGVGEPGVPPIAPAIANAYARLTKTRIRTLPMFPAASTMSD
ncbi:molybdopterin cofactor-binding domain-containing protein [Parvibaculum sp.]|uniref:xanthine dehydrogenase family protein molybdopterin-binding subunit n=1 Tax=Parvibaculum sp. TaxID=2024848 RepID=UPI00320F7E5F